MVRQGFRQAQGLLNVDEPELVNAESLIISADISIFSGQP
jgi:hypothetical protein